MHANPNFEDEAIARAADLVRQADALIIAAGAGMGVDSGFPIFGVIPAFGRPIPL